MKKIISILLLFLIVFSHAQSYSEFAATYDLKYNDGGRILKEQYLLLMNPKNNESLFTPSSFYVKDSLVFHHKFQETLANYSKYSALVKNKIYNKNGNITIAEIVGDVKVRFTQKMPIEWTISEETKKEKGYTQKKATCFAFGRKWIAWFTPDVPMNFFPYRFKGLPGFVFYISDEKGDIIFELTQFKKRKKRIYPLSLKKFKTIRESDLEKIKYNYYVLGLLKIQGFETPKQKEQERKNLENYYRTLVRIEKVKLK